MKFKGKISTTGTSNAIRLDKNLFKQHPEFKQQAEVKAVVLGPGTLLVSLVDNNQVETQEEDPILDAFLSFLEQDVLKNPQHIAPLPAEKIKKALKLTKDVQATDADFD